MKSSLFICKHHLTFHYHIDKEMVDFGCVKERLQLKRFNFTADQHFCESMANWVRQRHGKITLEIHKPKLGKYLSMSVRGRGGLGITRHGIVFHRTRKIMLLRHVVYVPNNNVLPCWSDPKKG